MLKDFTYQFKAGPLATRAELESDWQLGNCRRAVQFYIYKQQGIFLRPGQVLCPKAYDETGDFVSKIGQAFSFASLVDGDIIYAESIRNKDGQEINKGPITFKSLADYLTALHTAIYTKQSGQEIWHPTLIDNKSAYWPLEKFLHFYRPVAAKRI